MIKIGIMVGRFQPVTILHQKIIHNMESKFDKNYVFIVEGQKSSQEKKNFLSFDERIKILKITNPTVKTIASTNGYLPDIINENKIPIENSMIYIVAGSDRISGYMKQFKDVPYKVFKHEIPRQPEDVSATKVRTALMSGDFASYKKMIAKGLDNEKWFSILRKKLTERYEGEV